MMAGNTKHLCRYRQALFPVLVREMMANLEVAETNSLSMYIVQLCPTAMLASHLSSSLSSQLNQPCPAGPGSPLPLPHHVARPCLYNSCWPWDPALSLILRILSF